MARRKQSDTNSHHELPNDYIIPTEYHDRYRLIFSHYNLDAKLVRIGKNGKQRQKSVKQLTYGNGSIKAVGKTWNGIEYPEKSILFTNTPQSAVKTLSVKICSTEILDQSILHKLHTAIR